MRGEEEEAALREQHSLLWLGALSSKDTTGYKHPVLAEGGTAPLCWDGQTQAQIRTVGESAGIRPKEQTLGGMIPAMTEPTAGAAPARLCCSHKCLGN